MHNPLKPRFELHKHPEANTAGHFALDRIADLILIDQGGLFFGFVAHALGKNEFALLRVSRNDAYRERLTDGPHEHGGNLILVALRHARVVLVGELGSGEESLDALPRENKAALVRFFDDER